VGCAAESYVLVGTSRPPISPDQVKIYLHAPAKYEEIAIVDASSRGFPAFTDQQKMNKAMARLKEEAASLGANGVLLEGTGDQQAGAVGTGVGTATATGELCVRHRSWSLSGHLHQIRQGARDLRSTLVNGRQWHEDNDAESLKDTKALTRTQ
jgi:hypothetical protein